VFNDVSASVATRKNHKSDYQGFGCSLLYNFCHINSRAVRRGFAHRFFLTYLHKQYPGISVVVVPKETVYPYDWRVIPHIFNNGPVPSNAYGIHWFAGHPIAQRYARKLTPETLSHRSSVIANCIRHVLEYQL